MADVDVGRQSNFSQLWTYYRVLHVMFNVCTA